jgi:hypothetical protein
MRKEHLVGVLLVLAARSAWVETIIEKRRLCRARHKPRELAIVSTLIVYST